MPMLGDFSGSDISGRESLLFGSKLVLGGAIEQLEAEHAEAAAANGFQADSEDSHASVLRKDPTERPADIIQLGKERHKKLQVYKTSVPISQAQNIDPRETIVGGRLERWQTISVWLM
jgi:hypothetical protein